MTKLLKPLAFLSLLGFPIAVILYRTGLTSFPASFKLMGVTMVLAVAVFVLSMIASFILRKNIKKAHSARMAALIAIVPILGLGSQAFTAKKVPSIHNISTDTTNPAAFDKVVPLRKDSPNSHVFNADTVIDSETGETLAQLQVAAYPEVTTLISDLSPSDAHAKAKAVAESLGWALVSSDVDAGIIEATETTLIWGFKDDVVVRIVATNDAKSVIDLHSVSRIGISDLGANAKRITAFLSAFKG